MSVFFYRIHLRKGDGIFPAVQEHLNSCKPQQGKRLQSLLTPTWSAIRSRSSLSDLRAFALRRPSDGFFVSILFLRKNIRQEIPVGRWIDETGDNSLAHRGSVFYF